MVTITFFGVRGSTPCPCSTNRRYGGNTACVVLEQPGVDPIVFDLGTGLRSYGELIPSDTPFHGSVLVSHLHWDHVQGLPFFAPILRSGGQLDVYGPTENGISIADAFAQFMRPPFFPVRVEQLLGEVQFHDTDLGTFKIGDATITVGDVPHIGRTNGYRVETGGVTVAYVSDHQQPGVGDMTVADSVLDLCRGADLLIHDAQYSAADFALKSDWGHCTAEYAVAVAAQAGVKRLALFHHDPGHDDDVLETLLQGARKAAVGTSIEEVILATERWSIALTPASPEPQPEVNGHRQESVGVGHH